MYIYVYIYVYTYIYIYIHIFIYVKWPCVAVKVIDEQPDGSYGFVLIRTHTSLQHIATHCNTLQHAATHCHTLQHPASHYNTLQHTATHCIHAQASGSFEDGQATATHCHTLQHTATHCNNLLDGWATWHTLCRCSNTPTNITATHCNTLQQIDAQPEVTFMEIPTDNQPLVMCRFILQLTATHCNTLQHAGYVQVFFLWHESFMEYESSTPFACCCITLQHTATSHCHTLRLPTETTQTIRVLSAGLNRVCWALALCRLQVTWDTLQHTIAHCSTVQHSAAHCNTL